MIFTSSLVGALTSNPTLGVMVREALEGAGHRVQICSAVGDFLRQNAAGEIACLLLFDLDEGGEKALEIQDRLRKGGFNAPIIFVSDGGDVRNCVEALKGGAADFLSLPLKHNELSKSVLAALQSQEKTTARWTRRRQAEAGLALLTTREFEVLGQLLGGCLNKEIAARLGIVEKTVKVHRRHIMEKMQARSIVELVALIYAVPSERLPHGEALEPPIGTILVPTNQAGHN